jgi:hypothetical protein
MNNQDHAPTSEPLSNYWSIYSFLVSKDPELYTPEEAESEACYLELQGVRFA